MTAGSGDKVKLRHVILAKCSLPCSELEFLLLLAIRNSYFHKFCTIKWILNEDMIVKLIFVSLKILNTRNKGILTTAELKFKDQKGNVGKQNIKERVWVDLSFRCKIIQEDPSMSRSKLKNIKHLKKYLVLSKMNPLHNVTMCYSQCVGSRSWCRGGAKLCEKP